MDFTWLIVICSWAWCMEGKWHKSAHAQIMTCNDRYQICHLRSHATLQHHFLDHSMSRPRRQDAETPGQPDGADLQQETRVNVFVTRIVNEGQWSSFELIWINSVSLVSTGRWWLTGWITEHQWTSVRDVIWSGYMTAEVAESDIAMSIYVPCHAWPFLEQRLDTGCAERSVHWKQLKTIKHFGSKSHSPAPVFVSLGVVSHVVVSAAVNSYAGLEFHAQSVCPVCSGLDLQRWSFPNSEEHSQNHHNGWRGWLGLRISLDCHFWCRRGRSCCWMCWETIQGEDAKIMQAPTQNTLGYQPVAEKSDLCGLRRRFEERANVPGHGKKPQVA